MTTHEIIARKRLFRFLEVEAQRFLERDALSGEWPDVDKDALAEVGGAFVEELRERSKPDASEPVPLPPLDLYSFLSHTAAPSWYMAAYGHGHITGAPLRCPACDSTRTFIRTSGSIRDSFILNRADSGSVMLPTMGTVLAPDDPQSRDFTGVAIPMRCDQGHEWLLDVTQWQDRPAEISVILGEAVYPELYPEAYAKWGDGPTPYDDREQLEGFNCSAGFCGGLGK